MAFCDLPANASVRHALQINPKTGDLLCQFHEELLRGDSPLEVGERELIAAYVSGLNRCIFCRGTHEATALLFGVPQGLIENLLSDESLAAAPNRLRPMLAYARKLTLNQNDITVADAENVFAAGWSERALHDTILIAATFNFMNRFVHGHGIEGGAGFHAERGRYLYENGYLNVVAAPLD